MVLQEDVKKLLQEKRVSEDAIAILEKQGYETKEELQEAHLTTERLEKWGMMGKSIDVILRLYGTPEKQSVAPSPPQKVQLVSGNPRDMRTSDLVRAIAEGERDPEFIKVLDSRVNHLPMFVRDQNTGSIDVQQTLELMEDCGTNDIPPTFWGNSPTETLTQILSKSRYANPLTGERLAKGDPWLVDVSEERRKVVVYARLAELIEKPYDEDTILFHVSQDSLKGKWLQRENGWKAAQKRKDPIVKEVEAALYHEASTKEKKAQQQYREEVSTQWSRSPSFSLPVQQASPSVARASSYQADRLVERMSERLRTFRSLDDAVHTFLSEFMKYDGYEWKSSVLQNPANLPVWKKIDSVYMLFLLRTLPSKMRTSANLSIMSQAHGHYLNDFVGVSDEEFDKKIRQDAYRYGVYQLKIWYDWKDCCTAYRRNWEGQIS